MKRTFLFCLICLSVFTFGCKSSGDDSSTSTSYEEMTTQYTLLTVSDLWAALEADNSSYDGTYLLVQGVLQSVDTNSVTLVDTDSDKAVTCTFETSRDLTDLENVLSNNSSSSDEDTVTVGGVNHFSTDSGSYPYLESCDYFHINTDA